MKDADVWRASIVTPRSALQLWIPDRRAPSWPARHVPNSIATMRARLINALAKRSGEIR
jgi:hypothetical protein